MFFSSKKGETLSIIQVGKPVRRVKVLKKDTHASMVLSRYTI